MIAVPRQNPGPLAFALSAILHAAVLWLLPQNQHALTPAPLRVTVQLAQVLDARQEETAPAPAPEPPVAPKPEPKPRPRPQPSPQPRLETSLPLLSVEDSMPSPESYVVPEAPAATTEDAATASAPASVPEESAPGQAQAPVAEAAEAAGQAAIEVLDGDAAWEAYGRLLYEEVSRHKRYPPLAIRRHWEGRAMISARFKLGQLVEVTLLEPGSGHAVLDKAALEMVRNAVAQIPLQRGVSGKSFSVVIPVDFKLAG